MDRTNEFRQLLATHRSKAPAVAATAPTTTATGTAGTNSATTNAQSRSILRPIRRRKAFTVSSLKLDDEIRKFYSYLVRLRPSYLRLDPGGAKRLAASAADTATAPLTDAECDLVDRKVVEFLKDCSQAILDLEEAAKQDVRADVAADKTTTASAVEVTGDLKLFILAVMLSLTERLERLDQFFGKLRQNRAHRALAHAELSNLSVPSPVRSQFPGHGGSGLAESTSAPTAAQSTGFSGGAGFSAVVVDDDEFSPEELRAFERQNIDLFHDLETLTEIREAERKVLENARLQDILSTQIEQQAKQIEYLYQEAVTTTDRVKAGNEALQKAKSSSSSVRRYILLFLIVMSLALLFLDWYD